MKNMLYAFALGSALCYGANLKVAEHNYHGVMVSDPYRHLEDLTSIETQEWVVAQNKLTADYFKHIPERDRIRQRLDELSNFERYFFLTEIGDRYFFLKNNGLQNQAVLYAMDRLGSSPEVVLDPNILSEDGTTSLVRFQISPDASLMAYGLSKKGSDWVEIFVRDLKGRQDLSDHLSDSKFTKIAWLPDNRGFFYCRYDVLAGDFNRNQKVYLHIVGESQDNDKCIYSGREGWIFAPNVTSDGQYLVLTAAEGASVNTAIFYKKLEGDETFHELTPPFDASNSFIESEGSKFWIVTDKDAPLRRVVEIDINQECQWREIIPETDSPIVDVDVYGNRFLIHYLQDGCSCLKVFQLGGKYEMDVSLPPYGTVSGLSGRKSDAEFCFAFESYTEPRSYYRYDVVTGEKQVVLKVKASIDLSSFKSTQLFYTSRDGTRIPMTLLYKDELKYDGSQPVYLYGYGGFEIVVPPVFSPSYIAWAEMGGVFACANIRGGGEYGSLWHEMGMLSRKQNVFDDFIAAAESLIDRKITNPTKLAIGGGSNGGLLVGACLNQRPELFGAAVPSVGVMDMLRFHLFTIGWAWISEYGSPDDPEQFRYLYSYSPLHNIRPGVAYPPTLIFTADHDDRVVPSHSYKYAATLQQAQGGVHPILIRISTSVGHGLGKPLTKILDENADRWAFLAKSLGMTEESQAGSFGAQDVVMEPDAGSVQ